MSENDEEKRLAREEVERRRAALGKYYERKNTPLAERMSFMHDSDFADEDSDDEGCTGSLCRRIFGIQGGKRKTKKVRRKLGKKKRAKSRRKIKRGKKSRRHVKRRKGKKGKKSRKARK